MRHLQVDAVRGTLLLVALIFGSTDIARAQQAVIAPRASIVFASQPAVPLTPRAEAGTVNHGVRGAVIGGAVLGVAGLVLANGICEEGESCTGTMIGYTAMGAVIGAVIGAFIGSSFD